MEVNNYMRRSILLGLVAVFATGLIGQAAAATQVPGHQKDRYDKDNNGFPDDGQMVNGHYTAVYAYDASGDYFLDYGDDRPGGPAGTVGSVDELDQETLTVCNYRINYRGDYGNDPFIDEGRVFNHINCSGYDDNNVYNYWLEYPSGERTVDVVSGQGNLANPYKPS